MNENEERRNEASAANDVKKMEATRNEVERLLAQDEETQKLLDSILGEGKWRALDTRERRAAWRFGYEHPDESTGTFSHPDTPQERFHGRRLLHPQQLTENDAYYLTLGSSIRRGEEVKVSE